MRHVAAYLLATITDPNSEPKKEKIKSILGSVGVEADDKQLDVVLAKFAGKNPAKLITEGQNLLASLSAGAPAAAGGGAAPAAAAQEAKPEAKKEEKKEESEEESDEDMGFGLFD